MSQEIHNANGSSEGELERLETWKGIAGFFTCDESTARRWEKSYGMPVHRYGDKGSGVYAYSHELQAWADEYLEVSPEGAPVIANEQIEAPEEREIQEQEERPKQVSDLASRSGRMRVLAFLVVVIVAAAYLLLKTHKPAAQTDSNANSQPQSSPAVVADNKSAEAPSHNRASESKQPPETKQASPSLIDTQAEHAFSLAIGSREAEGTNELRNIVRAHPDELQPKRYLAEVLLEQRHIPEALPVEDDIARLSGESRDTTTARALYEGWDHGRTVGAFIALLKADQREFTHDRSVAAQMALAALQLGHDDEAVKYLRYSLDSKDPRALALANGIFAKKLSRNAEFAELRRRLPNQ